MTHDEMLDKIYWHWRKDDRGDGLQPMIDYRRALLAVVKLHKPDGQSKPFPDWANCCGEAYPCQTIQAIEKELNG